MSLTKDQILSCQDRQIEKVLTPEWGEDGHIYVLSLTGKERDRFEAGSVLKDRKSGEYDVKMDNLRARLVTMTACTESGELLFSRDDVKQLGQRNAAVISRIYDVAARLSGITKQDLEELVKNSEAVPNEDTT